MVIQYILRRLNHVYCSILKGYFIKQKYVESTEFLHTHKKEKSNNPNQNTNPEAAVLRCIHFSTSSLCQMSHELWICDNNPQPTALAKDNTFFLALSISDFSIRKMLLDATLINTWRGCCLQKHQMRQWIKEVIAAMGKKQGDYYKYFDKVSTL